MKRLGIVGVGFVGSALGEGMCHAFEIFGHDARLPGSVWHWERGVRNILPIAKPPLQHLVDEVDGPIFVCVPTPMKPDGSADLSIVTSVVKSIDKLCVTKKKVVAIKSTVPPGTTERLNKECKNIDVCFNPEFLREATALEDFKNQDHIILGGPHSGTAVLKQMYQKAYPDVPTTKTNSTIAEMVKYVKNCFLATKVSFANEIYQICEALGVDYDKVIEYATQDKRLGTSHWAVPGPMPSSDGSLKPGFGGKCFCKDLNALMSLAKNLGVDPAVMRGAWDKNIEIRPERDWESIVGVLSK